MQSSQCLSTILLLLLGGNTHRLAEAARGLGVLSTHLQVPVVTQTAVRSTHHHPANVPLPHLLQTVQILTEIGLKVVGDHLAVLSGLNVLLSVQEPLGDIELKRRDSHGETTTNTLDRGQGIDNLLLSINVSVQNTKNVLELSLVNKRLQNALGWIHDRECNLPYRKVS